MKYLLFAMLICACAVSSSHGKEIDCAPAALSNTARRAHIIQERLKRVRVEEMDTEVPAPVREHLGQLKDALVVTADQVLSCSTPTTDPVELQTKLADLLSANAPEPPENTVIAKDDHRFDEALGSYGHNLRIGVSRSRNSSLLELDFSINIECGNDHMLLVYALQNGAWNRLIRWQAPPLKEVSDAFGDFFLSAILSNPKADAMPRLVVAHGRPWCSSRFSGFDIDVLSPTFNADSPKVLWHTRRGYSRGDFEPKLKSSGNIFEFRINESSMDIDAFERRVIYRYRVDDDSFARLQPFAMNARGFVEEWLAAPWSESLLSSAPDARGALEPVHYAFEPRVKSETEFVMHTYGPVTACKSPSIFQVQINSTLEEIIPGKPDGGSRPLPTYYFLVQDIKTGYSMLSARTQPDPTCTGPNLMAAPK